MTTTTTETTTTPAAESPMTLVVKDGLTAAQVDGQTIVNTTPHALTFQTAAGALISVPTCGALLNAELVETSHGKDATGAEIVSITEEPTTAGMDLVEKIFAAFGPHARIIGSVLAVNAYPELVWGMVAVPGFERVPPAEKRMRLDRFTVKKA